MHLMYHCAAKLSGSDPMRVIYTFIYSLIKQKISSVTGEKDGK